MNQDRHDAEDCDRGTRQPEDHREVSDLFTEAFAETERRDRIDTPTCWLSDAGERATHTN